MSENKRRLTAEEIARIPSELEGWNVDGKFIVKNFVFENFKQINAFLLHLTKTIVELNHHPDFSFDSGRKTVSARVTTHSEGGLTHADLDLARALNNWRKDGE